MDQIDASRQTTRMSANVSGFGKTMRITMNDNLLRRGSLEEIEAVMGHEMGHYVLNHIPKDIDFFLIVVVAGVRLPALVAGLVPERWGAKWGIRGVSDPAVLPLVVLLVSIFFFVLTPIHEHPHSHCRKPRPTCSASTPAASPTGSRRPRFIWASIAR